MNLRLLLAAALACTLAACASDPFDAARKKDTAEAYQQFLREHPNEPGDEAARERLAQLRFKEARQAHTALAYKRFLEDFPASEHADDAEKLLEGLRFGAAEQANTISAYEEFLREQPDGAHATQARTALEALCWTAAQKAPDAASMKAFLARFPGSSHKAEATRVFDDRAFAEAKTEGNAGVLGYLDHASDGAHREEARALLYGQQAEAVAAGGDLAEAYQLAARVHGPARAALLDRLAHQELIEVAANLDPTSLAALAQRQPQVAAQALALAREMKRDPKLPTLRAQLPHLDPAAFGRPADELVHALEAPDPRDRWEAAEELGELGAMAAYDKLLDVAADSAFEEVRVRAFLALQKLAARTGQQAMAVHARERLEKLRKMASGPRMFLKIALVEELAGMKNPARADYRKCLRGDGEDQLALRRLLELEPPGFERAVFARRLATTLEQLSKDHARDGGDPPLLAARWYCGALHDATAAQGALDALPPQVVANAPEDIPSFRERARTVLAEIKARFDDAEDSARVEKPGFTGCEQDGVRARMQEGVSARLVAVSAIAAAGSKLSRYPLQRAALRDPSPEVRAAAAKALGNEAVPVAQKGR